MKIAASSACFSAMLATFAMSGCTPKPIAAQPPVQREHMAYLVNTAQTAPTCTIGADCVEKWARAQSWVRHHSSYDMRPVTDTEITTLGPVDPTTDSAYIVTKTQVDASTARINFSSNCGKAPACVPSALELKASFNHYVRTGQE